MPAWAITALWQYGIPLLIALLRKLGAFNWAQALEAKMVVKLASLKTYHEPKDFPDAPPINPDQPGTTNTNLTVGGYHDEGPKSM
jgi:hypothetical protein